MSLATHVVHVHPLRKFPPARSAALDDLLTAVGSRRDAKAFAVLFGHFAPRVRTHMVRRGLAPVAAEDVTQDVMESVWRKAHLYEAGKSAATTWVLHIARNRRIDVLRRGREHAVPAETFFDIPDPAQDGDERLDSCQRQECIRRALASLPDEQLTMIRLAFFEELPHSAIAKRLGLPLGTVKSRLRLAFDRLRRLLREDGVLAASA